MVQATENFTMTEQTNGQHWTEVIAPRRSIFDWRMKEVWHYRDLLFLFVRRDFVATYKQTILGPLWHFIQPLLTTAIFLIIFGRIAKIPTDGIEAIPFYMSGLTIWNYFSACLTGTSNTFVSNAAIFGKVYFPRLVIPLSVIISNLIRFGIQFLLLLCALAYYGITKGDFHFGVSWLLIPVLVFLMSGMGLGFGILISSLTTKYKDLAVLISFGVQLLMYATPIVYPMSYLVNAGKLVTVIRYNPLTPVVEGFKYAIFGRPDFNFASLGYSLAWMIVVLIIGMMTFNKTERSFMDTV